MAYSGEVTVGGAPDTRDLGALTITKVAVGPGDNNAYLLRCTRTGAALLIDAANDADTLLALTSSVPLGTVVTTHRHHDHHQALAAVVAGSGAATVAHPLDAPALPVPVTRPVQHGDVVSVGDVDLRIIHLRGHTPGSIALYYDADGGHLFTGDSLFPGGPGGTFGNEANFASLMDDLEERIFGTLPDSVWFYPGHGKDSTLGAQRPSLSEWRARGW